jgi:hypothetical protein
LRAGFVQARLTVNEAGDAYEQEAERTADAVTRTDQPPIGRDTSSFGGGGGGAGGGLTESLRPLVQRAVTKDEDEKKKRREEGTTRIQKSAGSAGGAAVAPASVESSIAAMAAGGDPLPSSERGYFESRFGHDFRAVRTHAGPEAVGAAGALAARAFTLGDHIFFGAGQYQPGTGSGRHLLAHELTHTIQQQPNATRVARRRPAQGPGLGGLIQRQPAAVGPTPPATQRAGGAPGGILGRVADQARQIPGYELLTVLLARDPITDQAVERSPVNLVHAVLKLVPDGEQLFQELERTRAIERAVRWFEEAVAKLDLSWNTIKGLFRQAWDALSFTDLFHPSTTWEKIKRIFLPPLNRLKDFALAVGGRILEFIKHAVLGKLSEWARRMPGYGLLKFILGKDPFTDEPVPRTARNFVRAVLDLVPGGDEIFANLEKSKTIERTVEWLEREVAKLDLSWEKIKALFRRAWDVLSVTDLLNPLGIIDKIREIFEAPARRVVNFAGAVGKKVLEFIFEGFMALAGPIGEQIVRIFRKIGDAFHKIISDPIGFVGNLVQAVKRGFDQFSKNILEHLKAGLIGWLVGALEGAGLTLPEKWDLMGILSLVLQILGITYAKMRAKMVALIGEPRVAMIERVFEFIKLIVSKGLAAAWEKIVEAIGSFWDLVIGGIREWAVTKIVTAAVTKLVSMLNPVGALIQAIITIYNTIAFFVERIKQILALVEAIVDSIANIAAGKLADAANYVERTMARTIPVILGFLARFIGLGDVSGAIKKVITAIQAKVDQAIEKVIAWVVEKAKALFGIGDKEAAAAPGSVPEAAFEDEEERHRISAHVEGDVLVATISSETQHLDGFLDAAAKSGKFDAKTKAAELAEARAAIDRLKAALRKLSDKQEKANEAPNRAAVQARENEVAAALRKLLLGVDLKAFDQKYALEGLVGTYGSMPKQSGDRLTPDHQPQAALVKYAADVQYVDPVTNTRKLLFAGLYLRTIIGGHATGAVAINLHENRHKAGLTFGQSVPSSVLSDVDAAAAAPGSLDKKRKAVIGHVRDRLGKEVNSMLAVATEPKNFPDVVEFAHGEKKAKPLIEKIKTQILEGEERVRNQDLDRWAS